MGRAIIPKALLYFDSKTGKEARALNARMMHMSEVKIDPTKEEEKNETPTFAHQLLTTLQNISKTF